MGNSAHLLQIYNHLFERFGPQHWWPGETPFEVVVGAILAQNTNWGNVEKAITNLKKANMLSPEKLYEINIQKLANLIRPSGFFNMKARRLKTFMIWFFNQYQGDINRMISQDVQTLRRELLSLTGIGPETADSILLYAANKPTFVVDAYTHRIFSRHGLIPEESTYDEIKAYFEDGLPQDAAIYNEYHALLVKLGKNYCKPKMNCDGCPARDIF